MAEPVDFRSPFLQAYFYPTTVTRFGHHIDREQGPATGYPAPGISFLSFGPKLLTWFSR